MNIKSGVLLALALICAGAAGVSGMREYDIHKIRAWEARRANEVAAVVELAHCDTLVGALEITQDGVIHMITSPQDMVNLEANLPPGHKGRAIVKGGCDTET